MLWWLQHVRARCRGGSTARSAGCTAGDAACVRHAAPHLAAASKLSRLRSSLNRSAAESREKRPAAPMFQLRVAGKGRVVWCLLGQECRGASHATCMQSGAGRSLGRECQAAFTNQIARTLLTQHWALPHAHCKHAGAPAAGRRRIDHGELLRHGAQLGAVEVLQGRSGRSRGSGSWSAADQVGWVGGPAVGCAGGCSRGPEGRAQLGRS